MKNVLIILSLFFLTPVVLFGKENLPAIVIGLKNDTLRGEIRVKNAFDKGRNQAYAYMQFSIDFTGADGQKKEYAPGQIKSFLIWTTDSTFEKFVSARLSFADSLKSEESAFRRPGMAARMGMTEQEAFVRVLDETGSTQLFAYYEEDVTEYFNGTAPASYTNSLNERFLVRKASGEFVKLNSKTKRRKAQLQQMFGSCPKINAVLKNSSLDTGTEQSLRSIVTGFNKNCNS